MAEQNVVGGGVEGEETASEVDPVQFQYVLQRLQEEENFPLAFIAGWAVSVGGAGIWAVITVFTGYQIGWMAVGVGFIVALAVRFVGKGTTKRFQFLGAALALFGCILGNFFTVCYFIASQESISFAEVLTTINPAAIPSVMISTFSAMDVLFYGIALYEGYRLSLRRITEEELEKYSSQTQSFA